MLQWIFHYARAPEQGFSSKQQILIAASISSERICWMYIETLPEFMGRLVSRFGEMTGTKGS